MHEMGVSFSSLSCESMYCSIACQLCLWTLPWQFFDVGNHIVTSAAGVITGSETLDVTSTLQSMFNSRLSTMG